MLGKGEMRCAGVYSLKVLESFFNKYQEDGCVITFECSKFACFCPIAGQPSDNICSLYFVLCVKLVESKPLKLYLFIFRSYGDFHEGVVGAIVEDLIRLVALKHIEIKGDFFPRGGISISRRLPITKARAQDANL